MYSTGLAAIPGQTCPPAVARAPPCAMFCLLPALLLCSRTHAQKAKLSAPQQQKLQAAKQQQTAAAKAGKKGAAAAVAAAQDSEEDEEDEDEEGSEDEELQMAQLIAKARQQQQKQQAKGKGKAAPASEEDEEGDEDEEDEEGLEMADGDSEEMSEGEEEEGDEDEEDEEEDGEEDQPASKKAGRGDDASWRVSNMSACIHGTSCMHVRMFLLTCRPCRATAVGMIPKGCGNVLQPVMRSSNRKRLQVYAHTCMHIDPSLAQARDEKDNVAGSGEGLEVMQVGAVKVACARACVWLHLCVMCIKRVVPEPGACPCSCPLRHVLPFDFVPVVNVVNAANVLPAAGGAAARERGWHHVHNRLLNPRAHCQHRQGWS